MGPYVVVTGAASVGAREPSLTVGYEEGSGYLEEGLSEGALLVSEPEVWLLFVVEARLVLELEGGCVEDACVEDGYLAGLEKLAGSLRPLFLAHVSGSTSLGQHRPLKRQ